MSYSQSFTITPGGWTGQANAICLNSTAVTSVAADVRLWADSPTQAWTRIAMRAGEILPLKVRGVSYANVAGVTMTGLN